MTTTTDHSQPLHKWPATIIDYDSDTSADLPLSNPTVTQPTSSPCTSKLTLMVTAPCNYATELLALKNEVSQLKTTILMAVEKIMEAIASLHANQSTPVPHIMDTDMENASTPTLNAPPNHSPHQLDLPAIISELKNEKPQSATRHMLCSNNICPPSPPPIPITIQQPESNWTSVGLLSPL